MQQSNPIKKEVGVDTRQRANAEEVEREAFTPKVSIIVPVYNGSKYIRAAIDSALSQTYRNFELIVIDDGSVDDTRQIVESYGDRLQYFWKPNGGVASALNLGIEKMSGAYFSWLSHDDGYVPEKLTCQVEYLRREKDRESVVFYADYEVMNELGETLYACRFDHQMLQQKPLYGLLRGLIHGCSLLIPKSVFCRIGHFDEKLRVTQDYSLWFDMIRVLPFKHIPEVLVRSRWHPEQDTKTKSTQYVVPECNALWTKFQTELKENEILSCEESKGRFFWELARFLETTPYDEARAFAYRSAADHASDLTVSVIMPFYNRLPLTQRALDSIRNQTHQRLQIAVIDDGSTDRVDEFRASAQSDPRVVWIRQENAGPANARNTALERVTGDFVAFLDSDDVWKLDKIETQLREMIANNWAISHTSYIRVWSDGREEPIGSASRQRDGLPRMVASCQMCTPSVMARRDVFARRRFPEGMRCGEDVITWLDIAAEHTIWGIDLPLVKVHVSEQSSAFDVEKSAVGLQNIYNFVSKDSRFAQCTEELQRLASAVERYNREALAVAGKRDAPLGNDAEVVPVRTSESSMPAQKAEPLLTAPPTVNHKGREMKELLKQMALLVPPLRRYVENHRAVVRELEIYRERARILGDRAAHLEALVSEVAALRAAVDRLVTEANERRNNHKC
jgi:glycosyltransferase involved in cell wall biosynthesis